ncbi:hypothetical protein HanIR_Chr15g0744001 [Helianthus annuus]|nr:hypothetical protein HanIR_Chr15g0744001 [Helianthus annuus]
MELTLSTRSGTSYCLSTHFNPLSGKYLHISTQIRKKCYPFQPVFSITGQDYQP